MTPDEVCEALMKIGGNVSRRTLLHYEEAGLIPEPERGGGGRNGRFTDYPEWTIEEAFAAWSLIHAKYGEIINTPFVEMTPRMPPAAVKKLRNLYYSGKKENDRTPEDAKEAYLAFSGQVMSDASKYYKFADGLDEFITRESQGILCDASIESVNGMEKIKWGFLDLWKSERLRARALLIMKKIIVY